MIKFSFWQRLSNQIKIIFIILVAILSLSAPALATINDDAYEGNIFILFAGNGSLVPPRLTLAESRQRELPILLIYYVDDSSDCKQEAIVVSRLQEYYGRAASFIPVAVDSIPPKSKYTNEELGYYYQGVVPQLVVLDQKGKVAFNGKGRVAFEDVDDALRKVFGLVPRPESSQLQRRSFNEFNTELVK